MPSRFSRAVLALCAVFVLAACGVDRQAPNVPRRDVDDARRRERFGTLFGPDALTFSTNPDRGESGAGGVGIGVNAFLWRASLQTLDFIPLASADPFGGVIITEWYRPPDGEDERFKLNVYITDTQLRADAIDVSVFREVRDGDGEWRNAPVDEQTAVDLENTILTRARELRIAAG
jgi:hypothetical protein